ncbi:MAG: hypothetical protein ACRCZF_00465, partial [Gemmataceae bacterium]
LVRGENQGKMRVKLKLGLTVPADPNSSEARATSRYSLADMGFAPATLRTLRAWRAAAVQGTLRTEYQGIQTVPELNNRRCHVINRTCVIPEVDPYALADTMPRKVSDAPTEAITQVKLMFDAETWLQIGSVLHHADGSLIGSYFFRDVESNPAFPPSEFR